MRAAELPPVTVLGRCPALALDLLHFLLLVGLARSASTSLLVCSVRFRF
jgi:hypothetical protein